jgi:hypothetical protein
VSDLVPARIDRSALERIIHRAAELQAREREIGEGLTDDELMQLGADVGIPPSHLRRALHEERARALVAPGREPLQWLVGSGRAAAERTVMGTAAEIEEGLGYWMTEGELLQVKRRFPDRTSWERKEGAWAALRRSFGGAGRKYLLTRAREVVSRVATIDEGKCLVQLIADLTNTRNEYLIGTTVMVGGGAATTSLALVLGVMVPIALVPAILSLPIAYSIARDRRRQVERIQVALEQILDRLEHGELREGEAPRSTPRDFVGRLAEEVRRTLSG